MTTVDVPRELGDSPRTRRRAGTGRLRAFGSVVVGPLLLGYLLVATVIALVTAWVPGARFSMAGAFAAACPAWLVTQHVPITIHGAPLGVLPLLPTGLLMALVARAANRAAYRLGCHTPAEARFLVLLIGGSHLVVGVLLAVLVSRGGLDVSAPAAAIGCGVVSATAATIGLIRPCGLFPMLFGALGRPAGGAAAFDSTAVFDQESWAPGAQGLGDQEFDGAEGGAVDGAAARASVLGAPVRLGEAVPLGVRAGLIGLLTLLGGGLALVVVGLGVNFAAASSMFGRTAPGVASGLGLVLLCVGYLPNAAVAATSLLAGPGFSVGMINVTMTGLRTGPVPDVPLLAALPTRFALWWPVGCLVPLLAGMLVGWWVRRIDELPQARLRAVGVAAGVVAVGCFVLAEAAGGRLGSGSLDPVKLPAGLFAVAVFCWIAVPGSVVAWLAGPRPHRQLPATNLAADPDAAATDPSADAEHSDDESPEDHVDPEHAADPESAADESPDESAADDLNAEGIDAEGIDAEGIDAEQALADPERPSDADPADDADHEYSDHEYLDDESEHADHEHVHTTHADSDDGPDGRHHSALARTDDTPPAESAAVSHTAADVHPNDTPSAESAAVSHTRYAPDFADDYDDDFDPDALLDLDPDADLPAEPDLPRTFSASRAPHPDHDADTDRPAD